MVSECGTKRLIVPVFEDICDMLDVHKQFNLIVSPSPPKGLVEQAKATLIADLKVELDEDLTGVNGAWSPLCENNPNAHPGMADEELILLEAHAVWVRSSQTDTLASISLVHEMVHAAQCEALGPVKAVTLNKEHYASGGTYLNAPWEIEAEATAQFIVKHLGKTPLREVE